MSKKVVTFGEIMLRLATPGYQRFSQATEFTATFGGGEANVSVSLANYGMESEFVTRLPQNDIARSCEMDLHKHGVKDRSCHLRRRPSGNLFPRNGSSSPCQQGGL